MFDSLLSAWYAIFTEKNVQEVGLDSGLLFPIPVVTIPSHLSSIQDFINIIKFVDFKVSSCLGFLFHLAPTVLGDFALDWTDHLRAVELVSPRPFQVVPTTLLSSFSHRVRLTDISRQISSHT